MRFKNGIEVNAGHSEVAEVFQFGLNSLEIAAEIVVIPHVTIVVGFIPWSAIPILTENSALGNIFVNLSAFAESVGENLIHYAAFEKIGSFIIVGINCKLKQSAVTLSALVAVDFLDISANSVSCI
jgi:hypothetical protein